VQTHGHFGVEKKEEERIPQFFGLRDLKSYIFRTPQRLNRHNQNGRSAQL
jgi:hypothetical protein